MNADFMKPVLLMPDGSYVVVLMGGLPYNVLPADPLWPKVRMWLAKGGTTEQYAPPVATPLNVQQTASQQLQALMLQYVNSVMIGPNAPKDLAPAWIEAWKAAGM